MAWLMNYDADTRGDILLDRQFHNWSHKNHVCPTINWIDKPTLILWNTFFTVKRNQYFDSLNQYFSSIFFANFRVNFKCFWFLFTLTHVCRPEIQAWASFCCLWIKAKTSVMKFRWTMEKINCLLRMKLDTQTKINLHYAKCFL